MSGFVDKHPYLTTILAIVAIGGVVQVVWGVSPVATKIAGAPKAGPKLPPKPVG